MINKQICIIGPFPPIKGGISQYDAFLANELKKETKVSLFSYKRQYPKFLIKNREQINLEYQDNYMVDNVDFSIDSINPWSWYKTLKKIKELNPDLVILPWWVVYWTPMYIFILFSLRKYKIKSLLICHNIYEHEDNGIKKMLSKIVLRMADLYLVHSTSEKNKLNNIVGDKVIIQHLLPLYEFKIKNQVVKNEQRKKRNLNLLFFGFIREYKGLDILLESLKFLDDSEISLTIVGEFWNDKNRYTDFIQKHHIQNISIVDHYVQDNEVEKYFQNCDVVVLPYRSATGSAVISTAYGYGKPVLVTKVGGLPDAVLNYKTGLIVKVEDLAQGIQWFKNDNGIDFFTEIKIFTQSSMSWKSLVQNIYSVIN